jgi:hypothetical protein
MDPTSCPNERPVLHDPYLDEPLELVPGTFDVGGLAVDDTHVYFTDRASGRVLRASKDSGRLETVATGQENPFDIVVDDVAVYWSDQTVRGGLRKASKSTFEVKLLQPDAVASAFALAQDHNYLYWASLMVNAIQRMPKAGGLVQTLASDQPGAQGISLEGDATFWVNYGSDEVLRMPKAGGKPEVLASGPNVHFPRSTIADCRALYVSVGNYGERIVTFSRDENRPLGDFPIGGSLALDAEFLYVRSTASLEAISRTTGRRSILSDHATAVGGGSTRVAIDDKYVYFEGGGPIWKRSKLAN